MKPIPFPSKTTPWCVQLPGRFSADRKRKSRYFRTHKEAEKFCQQVKKLGLAAVHQQTANQKTIEEFAPLVQAALARLGGDPVKLFEAVSDYERNRLSVKPATVPQALDEFLKSRKKKVSQRTWEEDRWRLVRLGREFEFAQMSQVTEADLRRWLDKLPGHTRSIYKTAKVFFRWSKEYGYVTVDPMAGIRPTEDWGVRKGIYSIAAFEKMLTIAAGLEGPLPGEEPTRRFLPLLPWFVLSGFCGLRSCEAFPSRTTADAIRWRDLYFDRGFIEIRESVAKITRKESDGRHIETPHYLEAAKAWLALLEPTCGFVVPVYERTLSNLKSEFHKATGIRFIENGFRNSFASYALAYDGKESVGKLALEMGNSEAVAKRFYIKTLEPRTGRAWFSLRPQGSANVVAYHAA